MKTYTYSHYEKYKKLKRNPEWRWYKPWIDPLIEYEEWDRFVSTFEAVDDKDANVCAENFMKIYFQSNCSEQRKVKVHDPMPMLEREQPQTSYIKTTGHTNDETMMWEPTTNLIPNSEKFKEEL
jgi:hypothetical protein